MLSRIFSGSMIRPGFYLGRIFSFSNHYHLYSRAVRMISISTQFARKSANLRRHQGYIRPERTKRCLTRSYTTLKEPAQDESYPIESKLVSSTVGNGLFATKPIKEGQIVFSELPLLSSQVLLNKEFVRACASCHKFLILHHKKVAPFFPTNAEPFFPRRYPQLYNYPHLEGFKYHYCSAECLDHDYTHFFQFIDAPTRAKMAQELSQRKQRIDSEWCTALPTIPPDLILKAICLEIQTLNPKMRAFHSRAGNRPPSARTPKSRLKILEAFKPTKRSMADIAPLCDEMAHYVKDLLLDYSPFYVDANLILDTVKRLLDYHQTIVLNVHQGKSIEAYMASSIITEEDKKFLSQSDQEIRVAGAGDIHLTWHPVVSAVYTAQSLINHSCVPNIYYSTSGNETHRLDVVAARPIAMGEEITASYLDPALLKLPTMARKGHIATSFGFSCECPACTIKKQ